MKVNGGIKAVKVRLIDENQEQVGVLERGEALNMAKDAGLDLVEVGPKSNPPVCRIMDYGKWLYKQKRKMREAHKHSQKHTLKEIRLRPETEDHDLNIKLKHAREFLQKGHKVQFTIQFRGRQMLHIEQGDEMMDKIKEELADISKIQNPSKMSGKRMILILLPK